MRKTVTFAQMSTWEVVTLKILTYSAQRPSSPPGRSFAADQKSIIAIRFYVMEHLRDHYYIILETMTKPKPPGSHLQQTWNFV